MSAGPLRTWLPRLRTVGDGRWSHLLHPGELVFDTDEALLSEFDGLALVVNGFPNHCFLHLSFPEQAQGFLNVSRPHDQAKTYAHVVNRIHLFQGDIALLLDKPEDRRGLRQGIKHETNWRINSREIHETVTRDMRQGFNLDPIVHDTENLFHIDQGRAQEFFAKSSTEFPHLPVEGHASFLEQ